MKKTVHHTLAAALLSCTVSATAFAIAPVVDESENFALFDEQLAAAEEQPEPFMQEKAEAFEPEPSDSFQIASNDTDEQNHEEVALAREDSANTQSQDTTSLFNKVQALQQELSELRGQLEVQTHALQTLKKQQLDFYQDLDKRLQENKQETKNNTASTQNTIETLPESTAPRGNPADEQVSYLAAYELVKDKEFDKAIMAMKSFIQQYPRGGYTANAHYWLGEVYMVKHAFPDAIQQFETVLKVFPRSSKSSASSLKLGYALAAAGEKDAARERLQAVIREYPNTHAAELASTKLETLKH